MRFEKLWKTLTPLLNEFYADAIFNHLFPIEQEITDSVLSLISEIIFIYDKSLPHQWDSEHMEYCFLEEIPKKVAAPIGYIESIGTVLEVFIEFMGKKGIISNVLDLNDYIATHDNEMVLLSQDENNWSSIKKLTMNLYPETKLPDEIYIENIVHDS